MKLVRSMVRYYAALRITAGAALVLPPADLPQPRTPIVRPSDNVLPGGFDRRETIERAGRLHVVTVPVVSSGAGQQGLVTHN